MRLYMLWAFLPFTHLQSYKNEYLGELTCLSGLFNISTWKMNQALHFMIQMHLATIWQCTVAWEFSLKSPHKPGKRSPCWIQDEAIPWYGEFSDEKSSKKWCSVRIVLAHEPRCTELLTNPCRGMMFFIYENFIGKSVSAHHLYEASGLVWPVICVTGLNHHV